MRCLVLGGAGFIGSHVVDRLVDAGHRVSLLDQKPNRYWVPPASVQCFWADWNHPAQVEAAVAGADVIIHLIGTTVPATSNSNMVADVQGNLIATLRLLQICQQHHVRRVIFSSSGGTIYGLPQHIPIPETHLTRPISSYGIVKLAIENYLHLYHHLYGLEYIILRGANPYGERQAPQGQQGAVGVFLGRLARSEPIEIWGDGEVIRDYLYVGDLAGAFQAAVEAPATCGTFNAGSGVGLSLRALLREIEAVTGQTPHAIYQTGRAVDVPVNVLDIRQIETELGWRPRTPLPLGLQRTWEWIQSLK